MRLLLGLSRNSLLLSPFFVIARHPKKSEPSHVTWLSRIKDDTIVDIMLLTFPDCLVYRAKTTQPPLFFTPYQ